MNSDRTLAWDWYSGRIPENVVVDEDAYLETSYSFLLYRSELPLGVRVGRGTSIYLGTMFDVGPRGKVTFGDYVLMNGARIICDSEIAIGDYCLISWNVVLMDTHRLPVDPALRRIELERAAQRPSPRPSPHQMGRGGGSAAQVAASPVHVGKNVW